MVRGMIINPTLSWSRLGLTEPAVSANTIKDLGKAKALHVHSLRLSQLDLPSQNQAIGISVDMAQ